MINIKEGAFNGIEDCEKIYIEGYDSEPSKVNYPDRQNYPKLLEDGWDKVSDPMISLPIVWEIEKIGTNDVGLWDALKYEDVEGNSKVVQNTDEGIDLVSNTIPSIMNIDELTIMGKRVKVCDVYDYDALNTIDPDAYKNSIRFSSEMQHIYTNEANFYNMFDYTKDDEQYEVHITGIKKENLGSLLDGINVFEMAEMVKLTNPIVEGIEDYWIDWSQADLSGIKTAIDYGTISIDTIRLPYTNTSLGYGMLPEIDNVKYVVVNESEYWNTIGFNNVYTCYDWQYRYAIDFKEDTIRARMNLTKKFLNTFDRLDILQGKSYQFDRVNADYQFSFWNLIKDVFDETQPRKTINYYHKVNKFDTLFDLPEPDGMIRYFNLDFNIFGMTYDELSEKDKTNVEYLKTYCDCTFTFLPQPVKENTKNYEVMENIAEIGQIKDSIITGKYDVSLNKRKPNIVGEVVFKNEYKNGDGVVDGADMVLNEGAFSICSTDAEKVVVEDGIYMIGNRNTFGGCTNLKAVKSSSAQCKSTSDNTDAPEFNFIKTFRNTPKLKYIAGMNSIQSNSFDMTFENSLKSVTVTVIDKNNAGNTYESFKDAKGISKVVINSTARTFGYNFDNLFNGATGLNYVEINGMSDEVIQGSIYTNFVSADCHMQFTVDTYNQKVFLESKIMEVLGISSMSETQITVKGPDAVFTGDLSKKSDKSITGTIYSDGTMIISGSGDMVDTNGNTKYDIYKPDIKNVIINDGITSVGAYAFHNCINIKSITIPDTVLNINRYAMNGCSSLTNIKLPSGLLNIIESAFYRCSSLKEIEVPDGVLTIGGNAFSKCTSLETAILPNTVRNIDYGIFNYDSSLKNVKLSDKITKITSNMFSNCTSLENITIPDSVIEIGLDAFADCKLINEIVLPQGVTTIKDRAFKNCSSLISISIPEGVREIPIGAFEGCRGLETIEMGNNVTNIKAHAFSFCVKVSIFRLPAQNVSFDDKAFINNISSYNSRMGVDVSGEKNAYIGENNDSLKTKLTSLGYTIIDIVSGPAEASVQSLSVDDAIPTAFVTGLSMERDANDIEAITTTASTEEAVEAPNATEAIETPKKKRGRPKKTETTDDIV